MPAASAEIVQMLPPEWVERIFAKLTVRYGTSFRCRYAGVAENDLRDDWAEQLAGLIRHPDAIAYALDHLPADRAPNVIEFKVLCNQAPPPPVAGLLANMPTRRPPPPGVAERLKAFQDRVSQRGEA
jgi:hypothetical protein